MPSIEVKTLLLAGVILLKLFELSYGFGATDGKIAIFWNNQPWISPNYGFDQKVLTYETPKSRVYNTRSGFWVSKKIFWGQKTNKKMIFF